jgi:tetratricopeptide (TPR) repeat protein
VNTTLVFVLDPLSSEVRPAATGSPSARGRSALELFGVPPTATTETNDGDDVSLAGDLAALLELVTARGGQAKPSGAVLVLASAAGLDAAATRDWLAEAPERMALVTAETSEQGSAVVGHALAETGQVVPVASLTEAFAMATDLPSFLRRGAWSNDPETRRRAATAVFAAALSPSRAPLDWHIVEGIAVRLLAHVSPDSIEGWELDFVRGVALRHQGTDAVLDWPDDEKLAARSVAERWTIFAHVVQSAADGDLDRAQTYAATAKRALETDGAEPAELSLARWRLRGAIGRALAAVGAYDDAAPELDACIGHWHASGLPEELSFPLCEALRVAGIRQDETRLARLAAEASAALATPTFYGGSFVRLALGRAFAQAGRHDEAIGHLAPLVSAVTPPPHVRAAACRWCARALVAPSIERWDEAAKTRGTLEGLDGQADQLYLSRLDEALRQHDLDSARRAVDALLECGPLAGEARRTLDRTRQADPARDEWAHLTALANEYRYLRPREGVVGDGGSDDREHHDRVALPVPRDEAIDHDTVPSAPPSLLPAAVAETRQKHTHALRPEPLERFVGPRAPPLTSLLARPPMQTASAGERDLVAGIDEQIPRGFGLGELDGAEQLQKPDEGGAFDVVDRDGGPRRGRSRERGHEEAGTRDGASSDIGLAKESGPCSHGPPVS